MVPPQQALRCMAHINVQSGGRCSFQQFFLWECSAPSFWASCAVSNAQLPPRNTQLPSLAGMRHCVRTRYRHRTRYSHTGRGVRCPADVQPGRLAFISRLRPLAGGGRAKRQAATAVIHAPKAQIPILPLLPGWLWGLVDGGSSQT